MTSGAPVDPAERAAVDVARLLAGLPALQNVVVVAERVAAEVLRMCSPTHSPSELIEGALAALAGDVATAS